MKPADDSVQRLLSEIEWVGQAGALDAGRLPDQPQKVPFVTGGYSRGLCVSQEMWGNVVQRSVLHFPNILIYTVSVKQVEGTLCFCGATKSSVVLPVLLNPSRLARPVAMMSGGRRKEPSGMDALTREKMAIAEHRGYGFEPTHGGTSFESMVQAFTAGYGVFGAQPLKDDRKFAWAADLRRTEALTVLHSVYQSSWTIRTLDDSPQHLAFFMPHTGSFRLSIGKRTVESGAGYFLMANNHEVGDRVVQGGPHRSDALFLDWKVVKRVLASLVEKPLSESFDLDPILDRATQSGQLIGNLLQTIVQGMRGAGPLLSSPLAAAAMSETLAHLVIRFGRHRFSDHLEKKKVQLIAPWHVRRAIDYMHANIAEPITMTMVADGVGVSLRALQTGFKAFRGTSPAGYLRTIRLQAAREQLRDPTNQQSVREICAIWGFAHAGRFSIIYRSTFGESPRDTRLRAERLR